MIDLIAVDPGVEYFAFAQFKDGKLVGAGLRPLKSVAPTTPWASHLVIEKPQFRSKGKERKEDVMNLGIAAGRIAEKLQCYTETWVYPITWKGTLSKKVHHPRICKALDNAEYAVHIMGHTKEDLKHILDAVGLGLWHLRRMG